MPVFCNYELHRQVANYQKNVYDDTYEDYQIYSDCCEEKYDTEWNGKGGGCPLHSNSLGQCQGLIASPETYYPFEVCQNFATCVVDISNGNEGESNNDDNNGDNRDNGNDNNNVNKNVNKLKKLIFCSDCYPKYLERFQEQAKKNWIAHSLDTVIDKIYSNVIEEKDKKNPDAKRFSEGNHPDVSRGLKDSCRQENIVEPEFAYINDEQNLYFVYQKDVNQRLTKVDSKIKRCRFRLEYNYDANDSIDCFCRKKECNYYYLEGVEYCYHHLDKNDLRAFVISNLDNGYNLPYEILEIIGKYFSVWDSNIVETEHTQKCRSARGSRVRVYLRNYNILSLMSGMSSLRFSD